MNPYERALGTPITAQHTPRSLHRLSIASAPAWLPLPPMTNRKSRSISAMPSTISDVTDPPRELPRTLPPSRWIVSTIRLVSLGSRVHASEANVGVELKGVRWRS